MILTASEYDKVNNERKCAESNAVDEQLNYNYLQAQLAGTDDHPNYARALYQSQTSEVKVDYIPVEGKSDVYEVTYNYNLWIYPNATVNPQGKDVHIQRTYKTGVEVRKDEDGNVKSIKL